MIEFLTSFFKKTSLEEKRKVRRSTTIGPYELCIHNNRPYAFSMLEIIIQQEDFYKMQHPCIKMGWSLVQSEKTIEKPRIEITKPSFLELH